MATIRNNKRVTAKVGDSTSPVVTNVLKGQPTLDDVQGFSVNFSTVTDGQVLSYLASSNTFIAVNNDSANTDYGLFNLGSF